MNITRQRGCPAYVIPRQHFVPFWSGSHTQLVTGKVPQYPLRPRLAVNAVTIDARDGRAGWPLLRVEDKVMPWEC
jgi:hypothetical protein